MKQFHRWLISVSILLYAVTGSTQDFVTRGKIEFEKKENMQRMLVNSSADIRDRYPDFRISYFDLTFAGGETLYKAGRDYDAPALAGKNNISFSKNSNILYSNYVTGKCVRKRNVMLEDYIFEDSIPPIKWKIGQETRKIAGYECRKAIGRIYDSVYVVAFYAEELIIKGGPEGIQGLPGMILGVAIPRFNTTWFATKVELANIDESAITPPAMKGKKLSRTEIKEKIIKTLEKYGLKDAAASAEASMKAGIYFSY